MFYVRVVSVTRACVLPSGVREQGLRAQNFTKGIETKNKRKGLRVRVLA